MPRFLLLKEIVRNSLLLLKRRLFTQLKRDQLVTRKEYDEGVWRRILLEKPWKRYECLEDYLCDRGNRSLLTCLIDGQVRHIAQEDYYRIRRDNVVAQLTRFAGGGRGAGGAWLRVWDKPLLAPERSYYLS